MTDYVLMPGAHYQEICDAIRERTGKSELLQSGQVAEEIRSIPMDADDAFWDAYQKNGERVNYYQRFVQDGWNDATFRPKYPITCKGSSSYGCAVFYNSRMTGISVPIFLTNTSAREMFSQCTRLKTISRLVMEGVTDCTGMFSGCSQLEELNIEGSIDVNFSLAASGNLSEHSVQLVLDCLKDLTGQPTQTLTLNSATAGLLSQAQTAALAAKNWTLVY